ncbi:hypothetical protein FOXG_15671 [Fusarium oxysporum f. sp. lycopersici 4287]|uniref:Uncharacterized protein n=1 Tax=Fusarium oxysporum f. sp. lycopersici (strain 4287 / CBS 123668 / FGSC 9935 / NRRL 34936) TaxID=426428 RepID=A0A0J9W565_FUSO4|nr:hypothetical protein FOXG_15671 [Fusarium oxysporum f. sp. lycopersici 4287]KNB18005.1 hypothetical protein FOXG_15671 [Fusarium oxysporum f. sp. lycopersici 4287]
MSLTDVRLNTFLPISLNPTITPLPSITRYAVPLVSVALSWSKTMTSLVCMSSRLSLLQYPLGLPSDGLEPLVVQAAEGCFDKRVAVVERVYEQEYLATKGCQPDAASIIPMQPGLSDFHRHITKLVVTVFLDSLQQASLRCSCDAVSGCDQKSDRITYCGSAVDDSSVVSAGVGQRVGTRL